MKHNLNVVIAESDPKHAAKIKSLLLDLRPDWSVVAQPVSVSEVLDVLDHYEPHVFFLALNLSGAASGLDVAKEVAHSCPVVLMTDDVAHAQDAFDLGAADFLLKPFAASRFEQALARAENLSTFSGAEQLGTAEGRPAGLWARYMQLISGNKMLWTRAEDIYYLHAEQKYTRVVQVAGTGLIRLGLQVVVKQLDPADFWQIHRSTVVNAQHIEELRRDDMGRLSVKVKNCPQAFIVSRNKEHLFRDDFFN